MRTLYIKSEAINRINDSYTCLGCRNFCTSYFNYLCFISVNILINNRVVNLLHEINPTNYIGHTPDYRTESYCKSNENKNSESLENKNVCTSNINNILIGGSSHEAGLSLQAISTGQSQKSNYYVVQIPNYWMKKPRGG